MKNFPELGDIVFKPLFSASKRLSCLATILIFKKKVMRNTLGLQDSKGDFKIYTSLFKFILAV